MHELSLCAAIADTAIDHAEGRAIRRINLRVGFFRQVVPETLQFCWEMRSKGTLLDGCDRAVEHVPATIECRHCGTCSTLNSPVLICRSCDGREVDLRSGDEFLIESIDLAPVDSAASADLRGDDPRAFRGLKRRRHWRRPNPWRESAPSTTTAAKYCRPWR